MEYHKISVHHSSLEKVLTSVDKWEIPESVKKDLTLFAKELKLGKVSRGKKSGDKSVIKYLYLLKKPLEVMNKPLTEIKLKDIEDFEYALDLNKIKSTKKQNYSSSVKISMRKSLKVLFKWKLGESKGLELTGWLDVRKINKTPEFLNEQEITKLYKKCRNAEQRFLVAVLFDSGARIEEFLNIRSEDIKLPEGKDNFVKIHFKEEYSKTLGRTIPLLWKYSLEAVSDFLQERKSQKIQKDEPVFNKNYPAVRVFLNRLGKESLGRSVYPHLFRHSSATFYANRMNRQQLCIRYGWKFSSNIVDTYISRAGLDSKELETTFVNTELSALQEKLSQTELDNKITKSEQEDLRKELTELKAFKEYSVDLLKKLEKRDVLMYPNTIFKKSNGRVKQTATPNS